MDTCKHIGLYALISLAAACGGNDHPDKFYGEASVSLSTVPVGVMCLEIDTWSASDPSTPPGPDLRRERFSTGWDIYFTAKLKGLPFGSVAFSASAFNVACDNADNATAVYLSDVAVASITYNSPIRVALIMRTNGQATVALDFTGAASATCGTNLATSSPGCQLRQAIPSYSPIQYPYELAVSPDGSSLWFPRQGTAPAVGHALIGARDPATHLPTGPLNFAANVALPAGAVPGAITVDPTGRVWVADTGPCDCVWTFDPAQGGAPQSLPMGQGARAGVVHLGVVPIHGGNTAVVASACEGAFVASLGVNGGAPVVGGLLQLPSGYCPRGFANVTFSEDFNLLVATDEGRLVLIQNSVSPNYPQAYGVARMGGHAQSLAYDSLVKQAYWTDPAGDDVLSARLGGPLFLGGQEVGFELGGQEVGFAAMNPDGNGGVTYGGTEVDLTSLRSQFTLIHDPGARPGALTTNENLVNNENLTEQMAPFYLALPGHGEVSVMSTSGDRVSWLTPGASSTMALAIDPLVPQLVWAADSGFGSLTAIRR